MRKRINRAAICSSENYEASHRAHLTMLKENHISLNISVKKVPYVLCFGRKMYLTPAEAASINIEVFYE